MEPKPEAGLRKSSSLDVHSSYGGSSGSRNSQTSPRPLKATSPLKKLSNDCFDVEKDSALEPFSPTMTGKRTNSLSASGLSTSVYQTEISLTSAIIGNDEPQMRSRCNTIETDSIERRQLERGEQINNYTLAEVLGNGSYGTVHRARKDGQEYAIKCLSKKKLKRKGFASRKEGVDKDGLSDLHKEVAILKKLTHPHIVRLVEVMNDPKHDIVYMVFELMSGGPVMNLSDKQVTPFNEERSCLFFRQLMLAVEFLHFHRVIHRDIKPDNILLYRSDHIKVADFGVSHIFEDEDVMSKTAGTPSFMAPEAVNVCGASFEGKPVDVWAMGVTLYCFLFGRVPFLSTNLFDLQRAIREDEPSYTSLATPSISPNALALLRGILLKNARERLTISGMRESAWISSFHGPLLSEVENTTIDINVTEEEVKSSLTEILSQDTLMALLAARRRSNLSRLRTGSNHNSEIVFNAHESTPHRLTPQLMHREVAFSYNSTSSTSSIPASPLGKSSSSERFDLTKARLTDSNNSNNNNDNHSAEQSPVQLNLDLEDDDGGDEQATPTNSSLTPLTSSAVRGQGGRKTGVGRAALGAILNAPSSGV